MERTEGDWRAEEMAKPASPEESTTKPTPFTIEHILFRAGPPQVQPTGGLKSDFDWLQCTRYKPPKLQSRFHDQSFGYFIIYLIPFLNLVPVVTQGVNGRTVFRGGSWEGTLVSRSLLLK
jgi:hypothetical protein